MSRLKEIRERLEHTSLGDWRMDPRDVYFYERSGDGEIKALTNEFVFAYTGQFLGADLTGLPSPGRSAYLVRDAWFLANAKDDIAYLLGILSDFSAEAKE